MSDPKVDPTTTFNSWELIVLHRVHDKRCGHPGGSFREALLTAIIAADPDNLWRISTGFPEAVRAWRRWKSGTLRKKAEEVWGIC